MMRETPEFEKHFIRIYSQPLAFVPVVLYCCPRRNVCICLRHGRERRYFEDLSSAVRYARQEGWISEAGAAKMTEEAKESIRFQEIKNRVMLTGNNLRGSGKDERP